MIRLARILGIQVYIHPTFWLLVVWVGLNDFLLHRSLSSAIKGVVFILILFGCVVLHEFGHALTARRYGVGTREITLYPIGGVARLERIPEQPLQELWIALAGPAVNGVIALLLWLFLRSPIELRLVVPSGFAARLLNVNLFLAAFNLIPAFPMDGGRVLRSLLALKLPYLRATMVASWVGKAIAFLFGMVGIFSNPMLVFIALFVWLGASEEGDFARRRASLSGVPVAQAMLTEYHVLSPQNTLQDVVKLILAGSQADFPVVEEGRVIGVLTRDVLLRALQELSPDALVSQVMLPPPPELHPQQLLDDVLPLMRGSGIRLFPVTRDGELVGLITPENIAEFLLIRAVLRAQTST